MQFGLHASLPTGASQLRLHGFETYGIVLGGSGASRGQLGYIGEGTIHFQFASPTPGAPVIGYFEGEFVQTRALLAAQ